MTKNERETAGKLCYKFGRLRSYHYTTPAHWKHHLCHGVLDVKWGIQIKEADRHQGRWSEGSVGGGT